MKFPNGRCYLEVEDKGYNIHPTENFLLGFKGERKRLEAQYHVHKNTQIKKYQKVIKNDNESSKISS